MLGPVVLAILLAYAPSSPPVTPEAGAVQQPPAATAQTIPEQPWPPAGVLKPGNGVTAPRTVRDAKPTYTKEAMEAKIQGTLTLEAVVLANGTVGEVRVTRSLDKDFGLDAQAVKAMKSWRFTPGKKDGVAVPVLIQTEMSFTLRHH